MLCQNLIQPVISGQTEQSLLAGTRGTDFEGTRQYEDVEANKMLGGGLVLLRAEEFGTRNVRLKLGGVEIFQRQDDFEGDEVWTVEWKLRTLAIADGYATVGALVKVNGVEPSYIEVGEIPVSTGYDVNFIAVDVTVVNGEIESETTALMVHIY